MTREVERALKVHMLGRSVYGEASYHIDIWSHHAVERLFSLSINRVRINLREVPLV
jgi:hypothetical protein